MLTLLLALQAVPPAAGPKTPPAMPITDCFVPGPWIIFFEKDAVTLSTEARAVLTNFVRAEADPCGAFTVVLTGHADGGERAGIDRQRATAVRRFLAGHDLRPLVVGVRGVGTTAPRIERPADVEEPQNRRVEIMAVARR